MGAAAGGAKPRAPRPPRLGTLVLAGLAFLAGCRGPRSSGNPSLYEQLEAENQRLGELFRAGNLLGVADLFADGAELFDVHGERIAGREELDAYWSAIESPVDWRLSIRLARGSEDLAYEIGTSRMTTRESGELVTRVTEFLMLWRRGPDGAWRIAMDSSWPKPR